MIFNKLSRYLVSVLLSVILFPLMAHALPGDLNSSGRVDGYDLIIFSRAYGSSTGDSNWNPAADLDANGTIEQADLDILSFHFGKRGVSFGLWVGDTQTGNERISKLSHTGNLLARVGSFTTPRSISSNILDGTVWVADSSDDKVVKLAAFDGDSLITVSGLDAYSVSVNPQDGSLWVADYDNNRVVQLFSSITDGYSINGDTGSHKVIGGFYRPRSVSVNPETGVVWVADSYNHRVVRLSGDIPNGYDLGSDTGNHVVKTGFSNPYEIAVNVSDGTVWVNDYGNAALVKLSLSGLTEIVRVGGFNPFFAPAVNYMDGSVWIADTNNNRVVKLSSSGVILTEITGVNRPYSASVNPLNGHCWVTEYDNHQVVEYSPNGTELSRLSGFTNPISVSVTAEEVIGATYPFAESYLSSNHMDVGETVDFNGTGSDPDGEIVKYEWDFDGDGTFDYSSSATGITTHTYNSLGIYNPVFRVTDNQHLSATDYSQLIRVGHLEATAGANTTSGSLPLTVSFTAAYLDPQDGLIDSYQWDFDGDSIFDYYSETTGNIDHTYNEGGTFTATLKITDGPYTATDGISINATSSAPTATANGNPLSGVAPLQVNFSGSGTDPDGTIAVYEWDFDGDGTFDWHSISGGDTLHTYMDNATVTASFRVTDNDGQTDTTNVLVNVGQAPPVAVADASPQKVYPSDTVNFDASGSYDQGLGSIVLYEWDFDGDGTFDFSSATTGNTTHEYTSATQYAAALQVTDNDGNQATDTLEITVLSIEQPFADASADSLSGTSPLTVNFTGTGTDQQGTIAEYHWNFGEEGTGAENSYTSPTTGNTSHTYSVPGIYPAQFTVTDNDGHTDSHTVLIRVYGNPVVTARSDISDGFSPLEVFFSGTATDLDGSIVKYEWDFDGDGTYDWFSENHANARHVYDASAVYNAVLRATDNDGYSTVSSAIAVTVNQSGPEAVAYAGPVRGSAPLEVNFSGTGMDSDGTISTYEWDFDNDGTYDVSSSTSPDTSHTYAMAGSYNAIFRVTDSDGNLATDAVNIEVNAEGAPLAMMYTTPENGTHPLDVQFRGSGSDADGTISTYEWDFDNDGAFEPSSSSPPTAFGDTMEFGEHNWTFDAPWTRIYTDCHSQTMCWTDSPDGDYDDNTDVSLVSATIDLSGAVAPRLIFWHRYALKSWDYARVEISGNNGANWTQIGYYSNNTLNIWKKQNYDLSAYAGNSTVKVRFRITSDGSDAADGWYIDDVWVGDYVTHTYTTPGTYTAVLRVTDNDGKQHTASNDISVVAGETATFVWVADYSNHQVVKISESGTELARIGGFNGPRAVEADPAGGDVWIADQHNDRVVKLAGNGLVC
ncbi:PKD domain-containing protein, partial [Thermodesulfobacteriota bacterium]